MNDEDAPPEAPVSFAEKKKLHQAKMEEAIKSISTSQTNSDYDREVIKRFADDPEMVGSISFFMDKEGIPTVVCTGDINPFSLVGAFDFYKDKMKEELHSLLYVPEGY